MIEEHLAEVSPMGKIELEEHLAPQRNVPPKIMPSRQTSVDGITEFLLIAIEKASTMVRVIIPFR
jgi:hypothetical protein